MTSPSVYDTEGDENEIESEILWVLELHERQHTRTGVLGILMRNGEGVGMLRCKSNEEFVWLKKKIDGTYNIFSDE